MEKKQAMEFLTKLVKELNTQDNRCTATPYYFAVQSQEWQICPEDDDDGVKYYLDDNEPISAEELEGKTSEELIDEYQVDDMENIKADMLEFYQKLVWVDKQIFLTEKAADEHIRQNHYHYHNPRTYVKHFWRNYEMEELMEAIGVITGIDYVKH